MRWTEEDYQEYLKKTGTHPVPPKKPKDTDERQDSFDIKIIVAKQRNGPTGHTWLRYRKRIFKFENLAREYL